MKLVSFGSKVIRFRVLQGILSLSIIATLIHFWLIPSQAVPVQKDLEREFKTVSQPPQATISSYESSHKDQHALVEGYYLTSLNYQQIRSYYVDELKKKGWKFQQESQFKDIERDKGGKVIIFCKGTYRASLDYVGSSNSNNGWTYVFNLSWGLLPDICGKTS